MGKRYYAVLRDAYQDMTSPSKRFKSEDDSDQSMDETLQDACLANTGSPVDITPLTDFVCGSSKELSNIETVVLYQHVFRLDPRTDAHVGLNMNVMKFIFRTKLHQRMRKEWLIMKDYYDNVLCSCWQSAKQAGGITEDIWLLGVWEQISLIYSPEQCVEIIKQPAGSSWEPFEEIITTQVANGKLALKLIGALISDKNNHQDQ